VIELQTRNSEGSNAANQIDIEEGDHGEWRVNLSDPSGMKIELSELSGSRIQPKPIQLVPATASTPSSK
jgi:hypothetical protein